MGTELTAQQDKACELAAAGVTVTNICAALGISTRTMAKMRAALPAFGNEFARAREIGAAVAAERLDVIPDEPDVQRARLRSENLRWRLSRQFRDQFGDRMDVGVNVTVNLADAVRDAKARALRPARDPADVIDAECVEIPSTCNGGAGDKESGVPVPALIPPLSIFD